MGDSPMAPGNGSAGCPSCGHVSRMRFKWGILGRLLFCWHDERRLAAIMARDVHEDAMRGLWWWE